MNFNKNIKIGEHKISNDSDVYFIAEIGANFDGSLKKISKNFCVLS